MWFGDLIAAGGSNSSDGGAITPSRFLTPALSLSIKSNMEGNGERGLIGESFDEYESRSGSDNLEIPSGDDHDGGDEQPPRKKKYHRHTPQQIQELESFFKEFPHPDEKQRLELSRKLGLENRQIKFWFQNRRTQMKTQVERHENIMLRQENDKLRAENVAMKDATKSPTCNSCGGPAIIGEISYEEHQLRIENARLKDELSRICSLAHKFLGRPVSSFASHIPPPNCNLDLMVDRDAYGGTLPMGLYLGDGDAGIMPAMPVIKTEMPIDRSMIIDLALTAMDELIKMAQADSPLWTRSLDGSKEVLNHDEYARTFPPCVGMKPNGFVTEATRDTGSVIISSRALVETLMDANRWVEMFPCMIGRASTIDVISSGMAGTRNGVLQLMFAEFRMLSPLVPVRQVKFLRFFKQLAEGTWAVVDISIDNSRDGSTSHTYMNCRRLPSGCVVQDMPNGYSKVTWIEHSEFDESAIHQLYWPLISSGMGFGAHTWVATLQRQCECFAILRSSTISGEDPTGMDPNGQKSMLKLAQRMTDNFCSGICASTFGKFEKLRVGNVGEDVRMMTRKNMDGPGEPPGVVLSAATSVWVPVTPQRLFDFLRNERLRSEWDILSHGGPMQEMVHIAKGQGHGNSVSLLRASAVNSNESGMLILQETWTDASGSLVVYAPVDIPSISVVMNGGDSASVALLPSGFSIVPDGPSGGTLVEGICNGSGSLLTVGFQILMNSLPTAKLTLESVETVNHLITCTIQKIKAALQV